MSDAIQVVADLIEDLGLDQASTRRLVEMLVDRELLPKGAYLHVPQMVSTTTFNVSFDPGEYVLTPEIRERIRAGLRSPRIDLAAEMLRDSLSRRHPPKPMPWQSDVGGQRGGDDEG